MEGGLQGPFLSCNGELLHNTPDRQTNIHMQVEAGDLTLVELKAGHDFPIVIGIYWTNAAMIAVCKEQGSWKESRHLINIEIRFSGIEVGLGLWRRERGEGGVKAVPSLGLGGSYPARHRPYTWASHWQDPAGKGGRFQFAYLEQMKYKGDIIEWI